MSSLDTSRARLAVDIGGTFTDVVVASGERHWWAKVLTTHEAPERGVIEGIDVALAAAGLRPSHIGFVIHGTTLATNALIERKGARTALLTTAGFRDTIELGTESRFDQYDINLQKQPPLIPRKWRIPIIERVAADGEILRLLEERSVLEAVEFLQSERIESVAVAFLHSYAQPVHERRVRNLLKEHLPGVAVSLSCEVSPEMREYERFTTTCANAYVQPLIAGYLGRLERELKEAGFPGRLFLMLSSGGITGVETARAFPIRLVESGPAGGAVFARHIAQQHGARRVLSFDMGGTTAKICLIDDFRPQTARVFEVSRAERFKKGSGMPVRIPVIEMVEIGAGGGSIARIDRLSRIAVGPDSAGSTPGPACYGRGGSHPTVTDADLVLGRIDPTSFAGGQVPLDPLAAREALARLRASGLPRMSADDFAHAIAELVDEAMANAARVHAVENGKTLEDRTLVAFGGAAPLHVARLAEKLGISEIIVPRGAGVGSAIGFLLAPISYELARTLYMRLGGFEPSRVNALLAAMAEDARKFVAEGADGQPLYEDRLAFARYVGQGHEIPIVVPVRPLEQCDAVLLRKSFERAYLQQYGRLIEGVDIEILAWTVTVGTAVAEVKTIETLTRKATPAPRRYCDVVDVSNGQIVKAAVHLRSDLPPGTCLSGPAIILEDATSTVVGPSYDLRIGADWSIIITRRKAQ